MKAFKRALKLFFLKRKILLTQKKQNTWILMIPSSLGEVLVCSALIKAFKLKHGGDVVLVVPKNAGFVANLYRDHLCDVMELPIDQIRGLIESKVEYINNNFIRKNPINLWPQQYINAECYRLFEWYIETNGVKGLNFIDMYRHIMRLQPHAEALLPSKKGILMGDDLLKFFKAHDLQRKKFIVLNTGNNTNIPAPKSVWIAIAKKFGLMGYKVIQNEHHSSFKVGELGLDNVIKTSLDLSSLYALIDNSKAFITGSNGGAQVGAALGLDCDIHILLPEIICIDYNKNIFKEVPPHTGSNYFLSKELISPQASYAEWVCVSDHIGAEMLVNDLCSKNLSSQYLYYSQHMIADF